MSWIVLAANNTLTDSIFFIGNMWLVAKKADKYTSGEIQNLEEITLFIIMAPNGDTLSG